MANFIQKFENQSAYDAAEHQYPNVSLVGTDIVYKMEAEFNGIIATFNVTSTSSATKVCNDTENFSKIWIDGVQQDTVQMDYTFDTLGEHTVKYTLLDSTTIGEKAFYICTSLTSITIPSSVTSIGSDVFYACTGLTSITIPSGVTSIGRSAFSTCSGLTSITIPNSVTSISYGVFTGCSGLTSITIPSSVTSIGNAAFYNCTGLTSITVEAATPPTLSSANAFQNTNDCPIYVPAESVETFKTANNWSSLASRIQAIPTT